MTKLDESSWVSGRAMVLTRRSAGLALRIGWMKYEGLVRLYETLYAARQKYDRGPPCCTQCMMRRRTHRPQARNHPVPHPPNQPKSTDKTREGRYHTG